MNSQFWGPKPKIKGGRTPGAALDPHLQMDNHHIYLEKCRVITSKIKEI